jgi:hypothetical protein
MNGKQHDHPLTDILLHGIEVYGVEADSLIRKVGELCSRNELYDWWESAIGWNARPDIALQKAKARYDELMKRAHDGGWEIDRDEKADA